MSLIASPIFIYVLVDPFTREWRYIGKTDNPTERLKNHINEKSRCHRSHWIQSIVRRGRVPVLKVLQQVPAWVDWRECEKGWIDHAIRSGWNLTNGTFGGDGVNATADVRAKISVAMRGRKLSPAHRDIAVATLRKTKPGDTMPDLVRRRISDARRGMKFAPSHCRQISESKRKLSAEQVADVCSRLAAGESQSSIAKVHGISQPTVCAINKGKRMYQETDHAA